MAEIEPLLSWSRQAGCPGQQGAAMERYTTFRIGGPAQLLLQPKTTEQVQQMMQVAKEHGIPLHFIGNGSNLLVVDEGVEGAVVCMADSGFAGEPVLLDSQTVYCGAGTKLAILCSFAMEHNLSGLEFAYGIPGTVGGAVYMNAGAYGGEMKDVLLRTHHIDPNGLEGEYMVQQLQLAYRHSIYMQGGYCITGAVFRLQPGKKEEIREKMDDYMQRRRDKQPLEHPSAGSTFKRPQGAFASQLIDECGLKGCRVGGVCVSTKHAGFIVNDRHGSCRDVQQLVALVQKEVQEKTGYALECEVQLLK